MKKLKKKTKQRITWTVVVIIVFGGGYWFVQSAQPQGEDFSRAIPVMESKAHVAASALDTIEYSSNPPTSGPHNATPAQPGFREEPISDGHLIHSLEHGLVWVSYHPRIGDEAKKLREITSTQAVIAPRESNDHDIAIAAWGRLDTFNLENGIVSEGDLRRVEDFIKRHTNQGPERIPPGQHGGI